MNWQLFGIVAGALTSFGFVPQIIRGWKTKHLNDLSYWMNGLLAFGMGMWLVYGINKRDVAIIAANIAGVTFNLTLMLMKFYYGKTSEKAAKKR